MGTVAGLIVMGLIAALLTGGVALAGPGPYGDHSAAPTLASQLKPTYTMGIGRFTLHLERVADMSQRHATDVVSLVFATMFTGFAVLWIIGLTHRMDVADAWWAGPIVLSLAGAAGLVASLRPRRYDVSTREPDLGESPPDEPSGPGADPYLD